MFEEGRGHRAICAARSALNSTPKAIRILVSTLYSLDFVKGYTILDHHP